MVAVALMMTACGLVGDQASLLERIVRVESGGSIHAINVNGDFELVRQPGGEAEAQAMARWLLEHDHNFDAGLAQVNSANFARLGITVERLFDPCTNLRAGLRVLEECRSRAEAKLGAGEAARAAALSCYNTGHLERGVRNGYVAAVQRGAGGSRTMPSTRSSSERGRDDGVARVSGTDLGVLGFRHLDLFGQGPVKHINRKDEREGP